jgi:hypothetical protein
MYRFSEKTKITGARAGTASPGIHTHPGQSGKKPLEATDRQRRQNLAAE